MRSFWSADHKDCKASTVLHHIWDHIMDKTFHDRCYNVLLHFYFSTHWHCWVEETSKSLDTALKCAHSWRNVQIPGYGPVVCTQLKKRRRSDHNHRNNFFLGNASQTVTNDWGFPWRVMTSVNKKYTRLGWSGCFLKLVCLSPSLDFHCLLILPTSVNIVVVKNHQQSRIALPAIVMIFMSTCTV